MRGARVISRMHESCRMAYCYFYPLIRRSPIDRPKSDRFLFMTARPSRPPDHGQLLLCGYDREPKRDAPIPYSSKVDVAEAHVCGTILDSVTCYSCAAAPKCL